MSMQFIPLTERVSILIISNNLMVFEKAYAVNVEDVKAKLSNFWDKIDYVIYRSPGNVYEASLLKIDSSKARMKLKWMPKWDACKTLETTAGWYRNYYENRIINTEADIIAYEKS